MGNLLPWDFLLTFGDRRDWSMSKFRWVSASLQSNLQRTIRPKICLFLVASFECKMTSVIVNYLQKYFRKANMMSFITLSLSTVWTLALVLVLRELIKQSRESENPQVLKKMALFRILFLWFLLLNSWVWVIIVPCGLVSVTDNPQQCLDLMLPAAQGSKTADRSRFAQIYSSRNSCFLGFFKKVS